MQRQSIPRLQDFAGAKRDILQTRSTYREMVMGIRIVGSVANLNSSNSHSYQDSPLTPLSDIDVIAICTDKSAVAFLQEELRTIQSLYGISIHPIILTQAQARGGDHTIDWVSFSLFQRSPKEGNYKGQDPFDGLIRSNRDGSFDKATYFLRERFRNLSSDIFPSDISRLHSAMKLFKGFTKATAVAMGQDMNLGNENSIHSRYQERVLQEVGIEAATAYQSLGSIDTVYTTLLKEIGDGQLDALRRLEQFAQNYSQQARYLVLGLRENIALHLGISLEDSIIEGKREVRTHQRIEA